MAADLEVADIQKVFCDKTASRRKKKLAKLLGIGDFDEDDDLRTAVLLDIYYDSLAFAVEEGFSWKNVSVFFNLMRGLLDGIKERSLPESVNFFKEKIQSYSALFNAASLKSLVDFVFLTFFQHYKLYQYVFKCSREEDRTQCDLVVEPPVVTGSMVEAIPKSEWDERQRLNEIDEMEAKKRKERQEYYCQQLDEVAKHLEEPYSELTSSEQPINKDKLQHIIQDVVVAQATVTETLLQETLDEMKDSLEYQHMRVSIAAEYHDGKSQRRKSGASSSKSKRAVK